MRGELVAFKEKLENLLDQFLVLLHICIFFSIQEVFAHRKFRKTYAHNWIVDRPFQTQTHLIIT